MTEGSTETIPAALAATVESRGEAPAVIGSDATLTWNDLATEVRRFAASLVAAGVEPGSRVALWAPNDERWIVAALGALSAGATLVPINTRFKGAEARDIIDRSAAVALIATTDLLGVDLFAELDTAGEPPRNLVRRVVLRGPTSKTASCWADFCSVPEDAHFDEVDTRLAALDGDAVSDILFTSGTTGAPKGVVQTHARTLNVASDWVAMTGLAPSDRYLMVNPYFHMFGLKAGILASVVAGATMYPEAIFDSERTLRRVQEARITVLPGPPTLYQSMLDHPERDVHDLSSLRLAVTGAADIPVELIERVERELPFDQIITGYGLTEAGTASATGPGDDAETIATTVGRARPGFELRIADGEPGEILVRGPSVMSHYLDDPVATEEALTPDRWLHTGDLGLIDDAGCLHIVGRSKDMFIVGGFNAYPAEIENMLLGHPAVAQVAVIGIPDDRLGEVGMAFVVRSPGDASDESDIVAWARDRMANYKAPRRVRFVDALPVNATGKVQKDQLRASVSKLGERPL